MERDALNQLAATAISQSLNKLARSTQEVGPFNAYPTYGTKDLKWQTATSEDWVSGFYPGCLWLAYELSGDRRFATWAKEWTAAIEEEKYNKETHDLGFRFMCTYGNGLRLLPDEQTPGYREIVLTAAQTLSQRYNPLVECLSSNWDYKAAPNSWPMVIDIMMNLEILMWGAQNGGDAHWAEMCHKHSLTSYRDLVRPDWGTYHIVRYDKTTGEKINQGTLQGAGDDTTWSRGHAWMQYGSVVMYRYTRDQTYLRAALKLTDYFIDHLPEDRIAAWDFQSDINCRDVSASAIVCAALFEMIDYIDDVALRQRYLTEAERLLISMCSQPWFCAPEKSNCLLDHSVQYLPINGNVDVPCIFADYYFLEALVRYQQRFMKLTPLLRAQAHKTPGHPALAG